jgi:hypothetical protein
MRMVLALSGVWSRNSGKVFSNVATTNSLFGFSRENPSPNYVKSMPLWGKTQHLNPTLPRLNPTAAFNPLDVCFCFSDKAHMDIVCLVCCKQLIHRECLMIFLQFQSSCPYCCQQINDIASVRCYPAIDRSKDLPCSPMVTPKQRQI